MRRRVCARANVYGWCSMQSELRASAMDRVLGRKGKVFADRYHAHALKTPTEVANAIAYVLGNTHIHAARKGRTIHPDAVDPLSSAANRNFVAEPRTWLLRIGWMWGLPSP